jgi:type I restriction enzyme S subunit
MSADINIVQLKDICIKVCSGGTPSTKIKSFYINGTIPWVKTKEVNNRKVSFAETYITEEALAKSSAKLIPKNSVIIAMYGNGGTAGRVAINKIPVATNQACCNLIIDPKKADYRFVFYYLRTQYQRLVDLKNGGAQQNLNAGMIKDYPFPEFPLEVQINIADVLEAFDDKIELNFQTNQTLENIAQAIFKSWFVDFEPTRAKIAAKQAGQDPERAAMAAISGKALEELDQLSSEQLEQLKTTAALFPDEVVGSELGEVPEGWFLGELQNIAEFSTERVSTSELTLETYISTESMLEGKKGISPASSLPSVKTVPKFGVNQILISNIRPYFMKIWLARFEGGRSNDVLGLEAKQPEDVEYLYNLLYQDEFFNFMMTTSKGAKMPRGDKKAIMGWICTQPSSEVKKAYSTALGGLYDLIDNSNKESKKLEGIRDALLPKLLSGELEIPSKNSEVA